MLPLGHVWSPAPEDLAQHPQALRAFGQVLLHRPPGAAFKPPLDELGKINWLEVFTLTLHGVVS